MWEELSRDEDGERGRSVESGETGGDVSDAWDRAGEVRHGEVGEGGGIGGWSDISVDVGYVAASEK